MALLLPDQARFAERAVKMCGSFFSVEEYDSFIDEMNSETKAVFEKTYYGLLEAKTWKLLLDWRENLDSRQRRRKPANGVFRMFRIFDRMADRGIHPYAARTERFIQQAHREAKWLNLPADLRYVITWAEKLGTYSFEGDVARFVDELKPNEIDELRAIRQELDSRDDHEQIIAWIDSRPPSEATEASMLNGLYLVLAYALEE